MYIMSGEMKNRGCRFIYTTLGKKCSFWSLFLFVFLFFPALFAAPLLPQNLAWKENRLLQKKFIYVQRISIENKREELKKEPFILRTPQKWGRAELEFLDAKGQIIHKLMSGALLKMSERSLPSAQTAFLVRDLEENIVELRLKLHGEYSILTPKKLDYEWITYSEFVKRDFQRVWVQALFLGIILVMACYNFVIFVSVRDTSYLYYVLSILGFGLYFFFYYGFGIELLWQEYPYWDLYSFAFIVPATNLARIYFTKQYLHLPKSSFWIQRLSLLLSLFSIFIMLIASFCWLFNLDWLDLLVDLVGFLGIAVLSLMLVAGFYMSERGFRPAHYFTMANLAFVLGGILFILQEIGWLPSTPMTRSAVQYGFIGQMVLFSLGLSSRLNAAQVRVSTLELERERERKQLLEEQSIVLKQKVAEQTADLRAINLLQDKLFSIISHDLRNPLVSLDSFLNLLIHHQEKLTEKEKTTLYQKAKQSLGNLNQLLSNLLLWSQSQMQQITFRPENVLLQEFIEETLALHSLALEWKEVKVEAIHTDGVQVVVDSDMFRFILRNLVGNAIKFSYPKQKIYISYFQSENYFTVEVKDEGVGMLPEQIHSLKEARTVQSTKGTQREKGTGLGLMLCKEFMEQHQGFLEIISSGEGTTVQCVFPKFGLIGREN